MARRKEPLIDPSEPGTDARTEVSVEVAPDADAGEADVAAGPSVETPDVPDRPAAPVLSPQPAASRPGMVAPLLGGVLAAIGGFGLSHFNLLGLAPVDQGPAIAAMESRLAEALEAAEAERAALVALKAEVAPLADRLAVLESAPAPEPPDLSRLDGLDQRLAAIEAMPAGDAASTAALAAKLGELERRLAAQPQAVDRTEIDAALARLAKAEAEATARAEEAATATEAAARAEALDQLSQAVAAGAPFQSELDAVRDPSLSKALAPHTAGVATLAGLQADFPDLARQTLDLARARDAEEGWGGRLIDFLAAQTGARSVTPREGNAPDAILSRAEFAVGEGHLADALAELRTLEADLLAPFADWIGRAEARLSVLAALEAL